MVRPSNPRLMSRVLEAVNQLCEGKGSSARDVLDHVKQNSTGNQRNLTMQIRRALKHAVNAGLLQNRSGRYKALIQLNPSAVRHRSLGNNDMSDEPKNKDPRDSAKNPKTRSSRPVQERSRSGRRRGSSRRRRRSRRRRSRGGRRQRPLTPERRRTRGVRKRKQNEEDKKYHRQQRKSSGSRDKSDPVIHKNTKPKASSPEPNEEANSGSRTSVAYSDASDVSDYDNTRHQRRSTNNNRQSQGRSRRRSTSRRRSQRRQEYEEPTENAENGMEYDEDLAATNRITTTPEQEVCQAKDSENECSM